MAAIVGKLTQGAADAGFVYATDVVAAGEELRAIELPARLQPVRRLRGGGRRDAPPTPRCAASFVDGLLDGAGGGGAARGRASCRRRETAPGPSRRRPSLALALRSRFLALPDRRGLHRHRARRS